MRYCTLTTMASWWDVNHDVSYSPNSYLGSTHDNVAGVGVVQLARAQGSEKGHTHR